MNRLSGLFIVVLLSISLLTPAAFAKEKDDTRPGWGNGDKNHVHTGPRGESVRPHQDIENDVDIHISNKTDSGHNNVQHNSGPVTIVTGTVTNFISFVIKSGSNIFHF